MLRSSASKAVFLLIVTLLLCGVLYAEGVGLFELSDSLSFMVAVLGFGGMVAVQVFIIFANQDSRQDLDHLRGRLIEEQVQAELRRLQGDDYREPDIPSVETSLKRWHQNAWLGDIETGKAFLKEFEDGIEGCLEEPVAER